MNYLRNRIIQTLYTLNISKNFAKCITLLYDYRLKQMLWQLVRYYQKTTFRVC